METGLPPARRTPFQLIGGILINILLLVMVLLIFMYITVAPIPIEGTSMENTIFDKQTVVVKKLLYSVERGDIVIVDLLRAGKGGSSDTRLIIKRVVAVGGDRVAFRYREAGSQELDLYRKDDGSDTFTAVDESGYIKQTMVYTNSVYRAFNVLAADTELTDDNTTLLPGGALLCLGDNRNYSKDSRYHGLFDERDLYGRYSRTLEKGTFLNGFFNVFYSNKSTDNG